MSATENTDVSAEAIETACRALYVAQDPQKKLARLVLGRLRPLYLTARRNTHWRGLGSSYRRELARLYLAALRAVESAERKGR